MATLSRKGRGYVIHFRPAEGGGRRQLNAGRNRSHAQEIRGHVTKIVAAQIAASPVPDATARWLNEIGADLHAKLVKKGLARPRLAGTALEVGSYTDGYIRRRDDLKPGTLDKLRQARTWLVRFFGEPRDMRTVTEGEARDWQRYLRKNPHANLSEASADVHVKKARQFWDDARSRELLTKNPFAKLKLGDMTNTANEYHVPRADALKIIDAASDLEWKMLVALARFGGARIPSEMRQMKWTDLNFEAGKMTLWSPKTERYPNRRSRLVPIAPELLALFTEALAAAPEGATYVFPRLRHTTNHVTSTDKLITRAGLEPWPRTFDNLRASCEVDWLDLDVPEHVVCAWMGHSKATARKHYVRPTDAHFAKVSGAQTAAAASGNHRKPYEHPNANLSEKQAVSQSDWLPRDRNPGRNSNEIATSAAKRVRQTVRDLSKVTRAGRLGRSPNLRRSLRKIIGAAKGVRP